MKTPVQMGLHGYEDAPFQNPSRLEFLESTWDEMRGTWCSLYSAVFGSLRNDKLLVFTEEEAESLQAPLLKAMNSSKEWTEEIDREKAKPRKILRFGKGGDNETSWAYFAFAEGTTEAEAEEILRTLGHSLEPEENHYSYSPTGRWFRNGVRFRSGKRHLFAILSSSLDC